MQIRDGSTGGSVEHILSPEQENDLESIMNNYNFRMNQLKNHLKTVK